MTINTDEILATLPKPVCVLTGELEVRFANAAFQQLLGDPTGDLQQITWAMGASTNLSRSLRKVCARLGATGLRSDFRWSPPGDAEPAETFDVHVTRAAGDQFVVVLDRISDMVQIEEIHSRTRSYLEGVLNNLNLGLIVFDAQFCATFINRDQAELFERLGAEASILDLIGAPVGRIHPVLAPSQWDAAFARVVHAGEIVTHAKVGFPAEEPESFFTVTLVPLSDRQRRVAGGVCVTRDISRVVLLENELMEKERQALVGQLAITLNHEVNNPLTAILGTAQLALTHDSLDPSMTRFLRMIETNALRIADVTRRLRELEEIHLTEYLKDGPLMLDLHATTPH
ncbi:MAG TPA: PAS domain-containing protein [Vicinamibacterales bacterium]|nr:PAS domain-containing protein [Vicinamibacterales bacterium]